MTFAQVLGREDTHRAMELRLAPMIHAIGASIGPDGRGTLHQSGAAVGQALTGVEIARRCCAEGGAGGAGTVLLRETLVQAERDLGDGTARLAVMAAAALAAGQRALAAGIEPGMMIAAIEAMKPEIDAAFAAITRHDVDPLELLAMADLPTDLAAALADAVLQAGAPDRIDLRVASAGEAGCAVSAQAGFVWDAEVIGNASLDALDEVSLIVADDVISDFKTLTGVIDGFAQTRKALVIAARGIEGDALALIERNRAANVLTVAALRPYDAGPRAATILEDLAIATGAELVAERTGLSLVNLRPAMLGRAATFRRAGTRITLSRPTGTPDAVQMRLRQIEGDIADNRYLALDLEHARRRHARLSGKWVEVTLEAGHGAGAMLDEARRVLASFSHAKRGGVIPGGGAGLAQIAAEILRNAPADQTDRAIREMLAAALRAPLRHQNETAVQDTGAVQALQARAGVHDPAQLSRTLVNQAMSLATRLLSIDRAVIRYAAT